MIITTIMIMITTLLTGVSITIITITTTGITGTIVLLSDPVGVTVSGGVKIACYIKHLA
jgi:hypothetical protein